MRSSRASRELLHTQRLPVVWLPVPSRSALSKPQIPPRVGGTTDCPSPKSARLLVEATAILVYILRTTAPGSISNNTKQTYFVVYS